MLTCEESSMKRLIVYGSVYGTTRRYADQCSALTGILAVDYKEARQLDSYDEIIYFGGLYAGGVQGLKQTVRALRRDVSLILVTVGLADVTDPENVRNIRASLAKQVPPEMLRRAKIFHLRGGIDYQKLSFKHKTMMTLLYNKVKHLPEEKKTAEVRALMDTFNQKVDFVNLEALAPIAAALD